MISAQQELLLSGITLTRWVQGQTVNYKGSDYLNCKRAPFASLSSHHCSTSATQKRNHQQLRRDTAAAQLGHMDRVWDLDCWRMRVKLRLRNTDVWVLTIKTSTWVCILIFLWMVTWAEEINLLWWLKKKKKKHNIKYFQHGFSANSTVAGIQMWSCTRGLFNYSMWWEKKKGPRGLFTVPTVCLSRWPGNHTMHYSLCL